jgi:hypothetical protein
MKKVGFSKTVLSGAVLFLPLFLAAKPCSVGDAWAKYVTEFNRLDDELYANAISNSVAEAFLRENAPSFSCPDEEIERIYHFRWWTYRKHLRKSSSGGWKIRGLRESEIILKQAANNRLIEDFLSFFKGLSLRKGNGG